MVVGTNFEARVGRSMMPPWVLTSSKTMAWHGVAERQVIKGISTININGSVVPIAYNNLKYKLDSSKPLVATIIKADIGGLGGHVIVHPEVMRKVQKYIFEHSNNMISSFFVSGAGDDISINIFHQRDVGAEEIHKLCYKAFEYATPTARELALYGPGQDLPLEGKEKFEKTGNVQGAGPSCAELYVDSNMAQSQIIFVWSDKTDPGSYSIPLYKIFNQIYMQDSEMLANTRARFGFWFMIQDVELKDAAKEMGKTPDEVEALGSGLIMLRSGVDNRLITTLLSDRDRYAVKAIFGANEDGSPSRVVAAVSTDKLHNIGGEYLGKDDPVMIMLAQKDYPAVEEIIRAGWMIPFLVAGNCRGSHYAVLMPSILFSDTAYSSNPIVTSATVSVNAKSGFIGGIVDNFFGPAWDQIRHEATVYDKWFHQAHGCFQPKVLPKSALEYQKGFMEALTIAGKMRSYYNLSTPENKILLMNVVKHLVARTEKVRAKGIAATKHEGSEID